jgi:multimeric flavodoxin WrbA
MNITVLAGSPKGNKSVTLQSVRWLQRRFPEHQFVVHRIAQRIKVLETDPDAFEEVLQDIRAADLVLWAFPVYYYLVHAHLKRFIELVFEREAEEAFEGQYSAAVSTSIHFYDHTAHEYVHGVSEDMGMLWLGSFSAHMLDLISKEKRGKLEAFFRHRLDQIVRQVPVLPTYSPVTPHAFEYQPGLPREQTLDEEGVPRAVVITDQTPEDRNLEAMVDRFVEGFPGPSEVVNLHDLDIKASCQGCIQCAYDNQCVFEGKDAFSDFYRTTVETAEILVFAGSIRDRYLSSRWKTYFDRTFFENHRPMLRDRQVLIFVSGPLRQVDNLREILTAYVEVQMANLVGIVSDEVETSTSLDRAIDDLALSAIRYSEDGYTAPATFRGEGGHKIFRDAVWGWMRMPFVSDHRTYKRSGLYDFPHANWKSRISNAITVPLLRSPRVRKKIYPNLRDLMVKRHVQIVEETVPRGDAGQGPGTCHDLHRPG